MRDLAFYNAGCREAKGARRLIVLVRRGLRRVLRPIFFRQVEIFQDLCDRLDSADHAERTLRNDLDALSRRQDDLGDQMQTAMAFGWDYAAMVRRLGALEDRVEAITQEHEGISSPCDDRQLALPFPEIDLLPRAKAS